MTNRDDSFPFPYGSDLHWLWGWGHCLAEWLADDNRPDRCTWMIFRPDQQATDAMMKLSVEYPLVVRQIQDHLDFVEKQWSRFSEDKYNVKTVSAERFVDAMQDLEARIKIATETIAKAKSFAARTDSKTDKPKKLQPENKDVAYLCRMLGRELSKGKQEIDIALELTKNDKKKADNLLRQARRFRHLWQ